MTSRFLPLGVRYSSFLLGFLSGRSYKRLVSFATGGGNCKVLVDGAVTVTTSLKGSKNALALDKLAENILVTIKVGSCAKGDSELGASIVLSIVRQSELTALVVSQCEILIHESLAEGTKILLANATSRDSKSRLTVVELSAGE